MPKNDQPIPNAVFHMLKAARLAMEEDMNIIYSEDTCHYSGAKNGCNKNCCVYFVTRSDGSKDCLFEMVHDAITSMTEE